MTIAWTKGERVAVAASAGGKATEILEVAHVGKLEIKTTDGQRWLTRTGERRGGGPYIRKLGPEDERDAAEAPILRAIKDAEWSLHCHQRDAGKCRELAACLTAQAEATLARAAACDEAAKTTEARIAELRAKLTPEQA